MTTDAEDGESFGDPRISRGGRYRRRCTEAVAAAVDENARRIKRGEVDEALGKLGASGELDERRRDAVETMADAIVESLVGEPTDRLRSAGGWRVTRSALRLFDPAFGSTRRPLAVGADAPEGDHGD